MARPYVLDSDFKDANGQLVPMTPLSADSHAHLDPGLIPGSGGLYRDDQGRLRCPIRGCGQYRDNLSGHILRAHACADVTLNDYKQMMGFSPTTGLLSERFATKLASNGKLGNLSGRFVKGKKQSPVIMQRAHSSSVLTKRSRARENRMFRCPA